MATQCIMSTTRQVAYNTYATRIITSLKATHTIIRLSNGKTTIRHQLIHFHAIDKEEKGNMHGIQKQLKMVDIDPLPDVVGSLQRTVTKLHELSVSICRQRHPYKHFKYHGRCQFL